VESEAKVRQPLVVDRLPGDGLEPPSKIVREVSHEPARERNRPGREVRPIQARERTAGACKRIRAGRGAHQDLARVGDED
jgi:hypothetical protein